MGRQTSSKLSGERALYDLKWFDYRPLKPDTATMAFTLWHVRKLGRHLEDLGEGGFFAACVTTLNGLSLKEPRAWKRFEVMEKLRRWCDKRFIRYEDFWEIAFQVHLDFKLGTLGYGKKDRKDGKGKTVGRRMIVLNTFASPKILVEIALRSEARAQEKIIYSDHPYFKASAWVGSSAQWDYAHYIAAELRRRYGSAAAERSKALIESGRLSDAAARALFSASAHK